MAMAAGAALSTEIFARISLPAARSSPFMFEGHRTAAALFITMHHIRDPDIVFQMQRAPIFFVVNDAGCGTSDKRDAEAPGAGPRSIHDEFHYFLQTLTAQEAVPFALRGWVGELRQFL